MRPAASFAGPGEGLAQAGKAAGRPALTTVGLSPRIPRIVRCLSVNIDHIATLRQARRESFPDPVHAAAVVELAGVDGITVHLRQDRRHISERDVRLLKQTVRGELTVEMAAVDRDLRFVRQVRPDQVTLVPEARDEVTTTRGLNVEAQRAGIARAVGLLRKRGIRASLFIDPSEAQVAVAAEVGADVVELNTDAYSRVWPKRLHELVNAARLAEASGLLVHVGHGLDYRNVVPLLERKVATGYSIGFAIVARAVFVGLRDAVADMKRIMEVYP